MGTWICWSRCLLFLECLSLGTCADYRPQKHPPPAPIYQSYVSQPKPKQRHLLNMDNVNQLCVAATNTDHLDDILSQIQDDLAHKVHRNFERILDMGSANPHAMGQKWLTAVRQLISAMSHSDNIGALPADIQQRARLLLQNFPGGSIGSYTDARGLELIRSHVAEFLWRRDYIEANVSTIFLTNGRIEAIRDILDLISGWLKCHPTGVLVPNPVLNSSPDMAVCAGMCQKGYILDEDNGWAITLPALQAAFDQQNKHCQPAALLIVNPSNPTGHIHSRDELELAIRFARANNLVIIADEGHQENIVEQSPGFISVRKVAVEIGEVIEIVSIFTASTGPVGEAGLRGGGYEMLNFHPDVVAMNWEAQATRKFCSNTVGQIAVEMLVNPPKKGEPSYAKWEKETTAILAHLRKNAELINDRLNEIPGVSAAPLQGAIAVFARLELPDRYIQRAISQGVTPDILYTQELLREKGVLMLPGTWFHEKPGTNHIRINALPVTRDLKLALNKLEEWQRFVLDTYADVIAEQPSYEATTQEYY